jgi:hypothetical protein
MPVEDKGNAMPSERERLFEILKANQGAGGLTAEQMITKLTEYDALVATKKMPAYALASTVTAAVSAIASAVAAYFSYAALHISH